MTIHVNIGEAKTRLSQLIAAAKRGEEVVIQRAGSPEVRLTPIDPDLGGRERAKRRRAAFGSLKGKIADIDWFEPISDEELALWHDGPLLSENGDGGAAR